MVDLGTYTFKILNAGEITPEKTDINSYAEEINEPEQVHTSTKQLREISDASFEKADL